jgi:hypothetical protein
MDPETAFKTLSFEWKRAMIGSPRDASGRPTETEPPYAPLLVARAGPLDQGVTVPVPSLRSLNAFLDWAKDNGFEQGVSLRVEALLPVTRYAKIRTSTTVWTPSSLPPDKKGSS